MKAYPELQTQDNRQLATGSSLASAILASNFQTKKTVWHKPMYLLLVWLIIR
jgi:hypothetical protein